MLAAVASFMSPSFLPLYRCDAAVEFRGELHTFVNVNRALRGVSGGDQRRRGLQASGLQRCLLFVGHETISRSRLQRKRVSIPHDPAMIARVGQPFTCNDWY